MAPMMILAQVLRFSFLIVIFLSFDCCCVTKFGRDFLFNLKLYGETVHPGLKMVSQLESILFAYGHANGKSQSV